MPNQLRNAGQRALTFIAVHRNIMRALVGIVFAITALDAFVFDRSLVHVLVGHSVFWLGLLMALFLIESAEDSSADAGSRQTTSE